MDLPQIKIIKQTKKKTSQAKTPPKPKSPWENIFFYLLILTAAWALFSVFATSGAKPGQTESISAVLNQIKEGKTQSITVEGDSVKALLKDKTEYTALKESGSSFVETLQRAGIDQNLIPDGITIKEGFPWVDIFINFAPLLVMGLLLFMFFKQARGAAGDIMSFGRSRAKLFLKDAKGPEGVTFNDVAGSTEAKHELTEVVDFLKNPDKYRKLGARIPKGVLLVGPPGVGKTLLARAVANEAGAPFFSMAGSEFMEMLVGVGASRVRDLFDTAKKTQPSLIFIDEIESIGRQRGSGFMGGHDEREQTLNQILVEMDGFDPRINVIVIGATNRPDLLDKALMRPGRFDRTITLELPDIKEREEIIKIHMRGKPFASDVLTNRLAQQTVGFSGADIENMLNEAAILAARHNQKEITAKELTEASLKVKLGPERRRLQSPEEKKVIAYHEAGHAIVASHTPSADPVTRISIVSRGMALGFTQSDATSDRLNESRARLLGIITMALGGRSAEELIFNELTTGAANDIEVATKLARKMVTTFGMSALGPINYDQSDDPFKMPFSDDRSPETLARVDDEIHKIIESCHQKAREILGANKERLDHVAAALIEKETLEADEFKTLVS